MALKKPSEYFKKNENITIGNSIQELVKSTEYNTISDFKNNLNKVEMLSDFSQILDNYRVNIDKVNFLSEKIDDIQVDIQKFIRKEDLDRAIMSQLILLEQSIKDVQDRVKGINERNLSKIRSDVYTLTDTVNDFIDVEVPKYKKMVIDSEIRSNNKYEELEENVNKTLEGIGEFVDNKYHELTETLTGINESSLSGILEDFKVLENSIVQFKEKEIPKYRGVIVETERKFENKLSDVEKKVSDNNEKNEKNILEFQHKLDESIFNILEKISLIEGDKNDLVNVVNDKIKSVKNLGERVVKQLIVTEDYRKHLNKKVSELEIQIIRNESHIKVQNKTIEEMQESIISSIKKLNLNELEEKNYELTKKVKYIEEIFEKFNEENITKQNELNEAVITEPASTKNSDPLTPLDKNYVTFDQLQSHYRLFINRIQQQLSTLGGGGETRLKYLDDIVGIATNPGIYHNKFLKYDHTLEKFVFSMVDGSSIDINTGGISTTLVGLYDVDPSNLSGISTDYLMVYDPTISGFKFVDPKIYFGINSDFNIDPQIDDFGDY